MTLFTALAQLSDEGLHGEVKRLVGRANTLTAELLAHLGEVEARGIHRERACSSLYTYCVYELCMSEDEAQRRCRAARLARQFPVLLEMLAEASIHLTGVLLIGPHLTADNQSELLARVRYRTKREIERIVGELAPASDLPPRVEVLHGEQPTHIEQWEPPTAPARQRATWAAYVRALAGAVRQRSAGIAADQTPPRAEPESCVDVTALPLPAPQEPRLPASNTNADVEAPRARYRIHFPAPARNRPTTQGPAPARNRHVPAEVRRTVWQRDDGCCAYTDARGQRCPERSGLEFHHRKPHARGGPASVNNLELRCRAHNALAAELDFGRQWMRTRQTRQTGAG